MSKSRAQLKLEITIQLFKKDPRLQSFVEKMQDALDNIDSYSPSEIEDLANMNPKHALALVQAYGF